MPAPTDPNRHDLYIEGDHVIHVYLQKKVVGELSKQAREAAIKLGDQFKARSEKVSIEYVSYLLIIF